MTRIGDAAAWQRAVPCVQSPAQQVDLGCRFETRIVKEAIMPFGAFLDSLPSSLFVCAHVMFLAVGLWAVKKLTDARAPFAQVIWLYAASQIVFLAFFGGAITMKMGVLVEQTLMVMLIAVVAMKK
jgi:uncharacterized membrane protein